MWKYILGAAAVVVVALGVRSFATKKDAEWQMRVERVQASADAALAIGASLREEALGLREAADSLALEAARRDTVIVTMIEELPAPPPDCEAFTLPRDSVILEQSRRHGDIMAAFGREREASARLYRAYVESSTAADSLQAVLDDRPRPLSPLIPSVGLGCVAGITVIGRQPDVACGLSLSWEVNLF
jgi:hypothetical protein